MNSKLIASAAVALAALSGANAFAQGNTIYSEAGYVVPYTASNVTRAQVQAEYVQAAKAGTVTGNDEAGVKQATAAPSTATRADVRAEAARSVKAHQTDYSFYAS